MNKENGAGTLLIEPLSGMNKLRTKLGNLQVSTSKLEESKFL
jgi:hypothetical protein